MTPMLPVAKDRGIHVSSTALCYTKSLGAFAFAFALEPKVSKGSREELILYFPFDYG
jgi:hypothetical protein